MYSLLPKMFNAAHDQRLRDADCRVFMYLIAYLDPWEWRPLDLATTGAALGLSTAAVAAALDRLVKGGYLHRGADDAHERVRTACPDWLRLATPKRVKRHFRAFRAA